MYSRTVLQKQILGTHFTTLNEGLQQCEIGDGNNSLLEFFSSFFQNPLFSHDIPDRKKS